MTLVRSDIWGLFVRAGGYIARPGNVRGFAHAFRVDDGGLKAGDKIKATHIGGAQLTRVVTQGGLKLHWFHYDMDNVPDAKDNNPAVGSSRSIKP